MLCFSISHTVTSETGRCKYAPAIKSQINERIRKLWKALIPLFEANELYEGRYLQLMKVRGTLPQD